MKKSLIILCALGLGFSANAFYSPVQSTAITVGAEAAMVSNSISHFMGKKLKVANHTVKNVAITHQSTDYLQLKADGTFTKVFNGATENGTYSYNESQAALKLIGDETKVYNVQDITQSTVKFTNSVEVIQFRLMQISKPQFKPKK